MSLSGCTWTSPTSPRGPFTREFNEHVPDQDLENIAGQTLCKPACAWTSHKSKFMREFTVKMPRAKIVKTRGADFCTRLRGRNAHGHVTSCHKSNFLQDFFRKETGPESVPDLTLALTPIPQETDSVWTHCLGKECVQMWGMCHVLFVTLDVAIPKKSTMQCVDVS